MKITGTKEIGGKAVCEKCGGGAVILVAHFDGVKEYGDIYNCGTCGAEIRATYERASASSRIKEAAPKNARPGAKPIIWRDDAMYDAHADAAVPILLPECPTCHKYPTYNMEDCPFCGQALDYSEKT